MLRFAKAKSRLPAGPTSLTLFSVGNLVISHTLFRAFFLALALAVAGPCIVQAGDASAQLALRVERQTADGWTAKSLVPIAATRAIRSGSDRSKYGVRRGDGHPPALWASCSERRLFSDPAAPPWERTVACGRAHWRLRLVDLREGSCEAPVGLRCSDTSDPEPSHLSAWQRREAGEATGPDGHGTPRVNPAMRVARTFLR